MRLTRLIFYLFLLKTCFYYQRAFAISYGAYGHHTLGSGRVLSLAGAYTSLSEDSNAFIYNPAGTGFAEWVYHFEAANNTLINDELDVDQNGVGEAQTQNLFLFGVHYKIKKFSIGIGQFQPYSTELANTFSLSEKKLAINNTAVNISYCLNEKICLGANAIHAIAAQTIKTSSENTEQNDSHTNYSYGISFRENDKFGFGYSISPKYFWQFENPKSINFFSVTIPKKEQVGLFYKFKKFNGKVVFDIEKWDPPGTDVYAFESNEYSSIVNISNKALNIYRVGVESLLLKKQKTSVTWRLGYYQEPSRIATILDRSHFTLGLESRIGPAILQVAIDQARSFNNTSQSFTLLVDRL